LVAGNRGTVYNPTTMKNIQQRYQETLDYIYSFVDFSRTHQDDLTAENFDLDRMRSFLDRLGNPQEDYRSLHIAGSKGKGSVSAFCSSVLVESGYQTGLYTSPHLKDFEERIQINHQSMPRTDLVQLMDEMRPTIESIPRLTTFEIMTGLGYLYFSRQGIDIAVVEVGLGGRLDSTNVISPDVCVITALYLDHTSILGDTLPEIAREKGGIIKPGTPVVLAPQREEAAEVIREITEDKNSSLVEVGRDYLFQTKSADLDGQTFLIGQSGIELEQEGIELHIPLLGDYQVENAAVAYAALQTLVEVGVAIGDEAIKRGFQSTTWPARFEIARRDPPVIFDAAHNPAAMQKLRKTIDQFFPDHSMVLVFGISEDKALDGMFDVMLPRTDFLICTEATHPRAMDAKKMMARAAPFGVRGEVVKDVGDALVSGLQRAGEDNLVLVTGSIFVAASARIAWEERGLNS